MANSSDNQSRKTWGDYYLGLFDGSLADAWFRWAEWLLVTAALYAAGNIAGSFALIVFAYISGGLALFYALDKIDSFQDSVLPRVRRLRLLIRIVAMIATFVVIMVVVLTISDAIYALFSDKLVKP